MVEADTFVIMPPAVSRWAAWNTASNALILYAYWIFQLSLLHDHVARLNAKKPMDFGSHGLLIIFALACSTD